MQEFIKNNKLLIGICCCVLIVALVVGIILMAGGNGKTNSSPLTTNPADTTENGEVTKPSDVTDPTVTDPTDPSESNPTPPTSTPDNPNQEEPSQPDDNAEPTDPEPTLPEPTETNDNPDEDSEIAPSVPEDEPDEPFSPDPTYDFTAITPGILPAEQWKSWDRVKRQAFVDTYDIANLPLDDKYNFYLQTQFNGYDCGFDRHHCAAQEHHDQVMAEMATGCPHCGGDDCEAFYARNMMGFTYCGNGECLSGDYRINRMIDQHCRMKHKCVLEMFYNAYDEYNGMDNNKSQQDFDELYQAMHGKTLREKGRGIGAM